MPLNKSITPASLSPIKGIVFATFDTPLNKLVAPAPLTAPPPIPTPPPTKAAASLNGCVILSMMSLPAALNGAFIASAIFIAPATVAPIGPAPPSAAVKLSLPPPPAPPPPAAGLTPPLTLARAESIACCCPFLLLKASFNTSVGSVKDLPKSLIPSPLSLFISFKSLLSTNKDSFFFKAACS